MMAASLARVSALIRRDLLQELSYHFQLFLQIFAIGVSVMMFYFLGQLVGDSPELEGYRGGYFTFSLIGLMLVGLSQACVLSFGTSLRSAQSDGTLEVLLSTATRLPILLLGTLVVPMIFGFTEAGVYLGVGAVVADLRFGAADASLAILLLILTLGTFAAVGIFSGAVIVLTKRGDPFSSLVLQLTNLLAGALFPIAVMPEWMQVLSRLVPATYGLRGIRDLLLRDGNLASVWVDIVVLVGFNLTLLPAGVWALSRALRLARVTGTLGNR